MAYEWAFYVRVKGETAVDSGDGLTFDLHGKAGQATPAPVVYVDGVVQVALYTFNNGNQSTNCSITFSLAQTGVVTCDYRWKYECDYTEDASVFSVDKVVNIQRNVDVNGRTILGVSYTAVQNFEGAVQWEFMPRAFWDEWETIVNNAYLFDIERYSDATEPRTLANLMPLTFPKWEEIPGIPDRLHVGVQFIQVVPTT